MDESEKVKSLCTKYGIRPSKKYGQNFLVDEEVVRRMCDAADLDCNDYVLEIGPGFGTLTKALAQRVRRVLAVEVDARLFRAASNHLQSYKNVELMQGDILDTSNRQLTAMLTKCDDRSILSSDEGEGRDGHMKVVASLPYSITSPVLRKFTEGEPRQNFPSENLGGQARPSLIVVLVQKEVAERVCAKPGQMSILSVAVQYYGRPEIVAHVPRSAFWPEPEVESAILRITITPSTSPPYLKGEKVEVDEKRLFQLVRIGFSSRRKMLKNNIVAGLQLDAAKIQEILQKVGLDPHVRAQVLSVENWIALASKIWYT